MRPSYPFTRWFRLVLPLVLLAANVGAPFRTGQGRSLLGDLPKIPTHGSLVRVRAVSSAGVTQGFRVVTGLSKGGRGELEFRTNSRRTALAPRSSASQRSGVPASTSVSRPNPPLRC